jgi:hypothetical protein
MWKIRKKIANILRKIADWLYPLGWHGLYFRGKPVIEEDSELEGK